MEIYEVLRSVGGPADLADVLEDTALSFDEAWDGCRRGDHRVWLAACGGAPIEAVIEAAATAVLVLAEALEAEVVLETAQLAVAGAIDELPGAIAACEALASDPTGGYRDAQQPGLPHAARAAMLLAHAAEGLAEGEARREATRLDQAQRSAALLGAGSNITLPAQAGPARLSPSLAAGDPAQGSFVFAVAAAAEAVRECVAAQLAGRSPDADEVSAAEREVDASVRDAITEGIG